MNRAERRKHKWRKIKKIYKRFKRNEFWKDDNKLMYYAKKKVDGCGCCSCSICGNPRRHKYKKKDKLTIQEKKAKLDLIMGF